MAKISPELGPAPTARAGTSDNSRMARGSGLNLIGALCSQSAVFAVITVLALYLGKADVGRYAECYAMVSLLGLLSLGGLRAALTRFVAIYLADGDPARVRGTLRLGMVLTVGASTLIAVILALMSTAVADLFDDPGLRFSIVLVAVILPAAAVQVAALSATQGWRSQKAYAVIGSIIEPLARLLFTFLAVALGYGLEGALWALVASSYLGAALACFAVLQRLRSVDKVRPIYELRRLFSFSVVSWVSALAGTGLIWADTLLLGVLSTEENVGTYTIATRLVTLAVFVMTPINNAFTPHIAHMLHLHDTAGVSRAYGSANRWIMRLSMPAFILLLVFPKDLLDFFGSEFTNGAVVTVVLAIGQMVSAAAGPAGTILNMSGRVVVSMIDNLAALIINISLNLWLIPEFGIVGAAVAWSLSLTLVNVAKGVQVRRMLGIRSEGADWAKTFLAAALALGVALAVSTVISGWLAAGLLGGASVLVVFVGVLAMVGIGAEDAAVVRSVVTRLSSRTGAAGRHRRLPSQP